MANKNMNEPEKLAFVPVLLRDTASDFYDSLLAEQRESWENFKHAFLARFGRPETTRWKDASDLWSLKQEPTEPAVDYIARATRKANRIPGLDSSLLRYVIINGLESNVRTHVLQCDAKTIPEILQAARVADVATSTFDTQLSQLLQELRHSNDQHAVHTASFRKLSARLDKLNVTSMDSRSPPLRRRVRFSTSPIHRPSSPAGCSSVFMPILR